MRKFFSCSGCLMIFGIVIIYFLGKSYLTHSPRAYFSMTSYQFRQVAGNLNSFYRRYGYYPPHTFEGSYYTFASDDLTSPLRVLEASSAYTGPPVDPYRTKPSFNGDQRGRAWFCDGRNSEFLCWYKGYPPRYYRGVRKDFAILIGNGPDKDADLSPGVLDTITTSSEAAIISFLQPYFYDGTNGSVSSGDIVRIVTPDYP